MTYSIEPPVRGPWGQTEIAVGSPQQELTQSLRRLRRAFWSEKITNGNTPLARELDKTITQFMNIMLAYGMKETEVENDDK